MVLFDQSNNNGFINGKMDGSVLEEKSSFKILGLIFSSKLNWGSFIISIAKTVSRKIGALIHYMKFLFPEVALICRTVGPSLAAALEPLAYCQNVASLSLFYRYYFGK